MKPVIRIKDFIDRERQLLTYGYILTEEEALIKFAELHVQAALEAADNNAQVHICDWDYSWDGENENAVPIYGVDSDSILNAYPLNNIK
jgi:hypothetical protein